MAAAPDPNTMDVDQEQETEPKAVKEVKSKSKANKKKSRKRKFDETDKDENDAKSPPKKKKKRGWTESEETLYREGLDLYGRDWKSVAKHVGAHRDAASIRSHSQIYFMKLLAQHKPLPSKVAESGTGYTLGGGPLNKYSSIAIRHFGSPSKVPMIDGVISDQEAAEKSKRPKKNKKNTSNDDKQKKKKPAKKKKKKKRNKYYDSTDDEDSDIYEDSKFDKLSISSSSRTGQRRSGRSCTRNRNFAEQALHETEPYGLRTEMEYYSPFIPPKQQSDDKMVSDVEESQSVKKKRKKDDNTYNQPFEVRYCPNALLVADIHSHLCRSVEIMGLLGGTYDSDKRVLCIKKCYPILEEEQHEQTVSADPADHLMNIQIMREQDGLELVGWYHSHPCFENFPSNTDCHQHFIHKYENETKNPYIGLIISSWSTDDTFGGVSNYRFFNIIQEFKYIYTPLQLMTHIAADKDINDEGLLKEIENLIDRYSKMKYDIYRSNFGEEWDVNPKLNLGQKVMKSIRGHLVKKKKSNDDEDKDEENADCDREEDQIEMFMEKIKQLFMKEGDVWWITNKPKPKEIEEDKKEMMTNNNIDSDNSDSLSSKENQNSLNE